MEKDIDIDVMDREILKHLEKDSRRSLKALANELNIKTSTIYNRVRRLQEKEIVRGFSVIYNPEIFNFETLGLVKIQLQNHKIESYQKKFVNSYAGYLKDEFEQILFISICDDLQHIVCIVPFITKDSSDRFFEKIKKTPYIKEINVEFMSQIIKGEKLFFFNDDIVDMEEEFDFHSE